MVWKQGEVFWEEGRRGKVPFSSLHRRASAASVTAPCWRSRQPQSPDLHASGLSGFIPEFLPFSDPFLCCALWREVTARSPCPRCRNWYSALREQSICVSYLEFCLGELPIFSCFLPYPCGLIDTYFHAPVLGSAISPQSRAMFNLIWKAVFSARKTSKFKVEKNWLACCSLRDCEEYIFAILGFSLCKKRIL